MSMADRDVDDEERQRSNETSPLLPTRADSPAMEYGWVLWLVYLIVVVISFGEYMQEAPRTQIIESIICRDYLLHERRHNISLADAGVDPRCKLAPVQQELAFVRGIEQLTNAIPTVMAIPYGILANKWGRNWIICLAIFGALLAELWTLAVCWFPDTLPLRLIWAQFAFQFIGGGSNVIITMVFVIVTDVVVPENRTNAMLRLHASGMVATILAPSLASFLMNKSVWLPWLVGESLIAVTLTASFFIPDTRKALPKDISGEPIPDPIATKLANTSTTIGRLSAQLHHLHSLTSVVTADTQVLLLVTIAFLGRLGGDAYMQMLVIYISERYLWTIAKANYLISLGAIVQLLALLFAFPVATHLLLTRVKASAHAKDRYLALFSAAAYAAGVFIIGLAPYIAVAIVGIGVACMGSGSSSLNRSLVSLIVTPGEVSLVFSVMSVAEVIGGALAGPVYSFLYSKGLQKGVEWYGLPFLVSGGLFAVSFGLVLCLREKSETHEDGAEESLNAEDEVGDEVARTGADERLINVH